VTFISLVDYDYSTCFGRFLHRELHSVYTAPFYCLAKSQVKEPPSRFPNGAPVGRDARFQSLPFFYLSFRVPSTGALASGYPGGAPVDAAFGEPTI